MAAPVWVLSVDLQTKTATFQSGMADAAKSARGSFTEIKSGASEMGGHISSNMFASRHAIMAVSEAFGDTMPRAISALLVHIGPVGAALEAAFPYAAIGLAAVLILEHFKKMREAGLQLTEDQTKFQTAAENAFNALDEKLLQAQLKTDQLKNDHLGALHLQLQLINKQSMAELVRSFAEVAKAADVVMKDLQGHWYTFGIGSDGAKHALNEFQTQYESLLAQGKDKDASDLLRGTRDSAEKVLALQKQARENDMGVVKGMTPVQATTLNSDALELKKSGVGYTEKELKAQQALVDALNQQVRLEAMVAELKKTDSGNAKLGNQVEAAAQQAAAAKAAADSRLRISESDIASERAAATAQMDITRASISERTAAEIAFADRELEIRLKANSDETAALDKYAKDYPNQLKGMHEKAEELEAQHAATVSEIQSKGSVAQNALNLANLEQGFRAAIDATQQASAARLAAIDAALRTEESRNMQDLNSYRELQTERVKTAREMAEEEAKLRAEAGKEDAENEEKTGSLVLAAQREAQALADSSRRVTREMQMQEEIQASNAEYALKLTAMQRETDALDKSGKDYANKLKAQQDTERQLVQQHENDITAIKNKAEIDRNTKILSAATSFNNTIVSGLTQVLMGHKSFASMMSSIGNEVASGMMQNAIKTIEANLIGKESDAAKAARAAYNIGLTYGGPAGIVLGPVFAAAAFSSMMAFATGTDAVPGVGRGDVVPAMLTPGEGVVPGGVMDGLRAVARNGGFQQQASHTLHAHFAPQIHAMDSEGVDRVLTKHQKVFQQHFQNTVRRMNK